MAKENVLENFLGAAVIAVAIGFLFYTYRVTGNTVFSNYELSATLSHADGLASGASDVLVSGLKVGTVTSLEMNTRTYRVTVHMLIHDGVKIPTDSKLSISSGFGSPHAYLSILPGKSHEMLPPGGVIRS